MCGSVAHPASVGNLVQRCCGTRSPLLTRNWQLAGIDWYPAIQRSLGFHMAPNSVFVYFQELGGIKQRPALHARDLRVLRYQRHLLLAVAPFKPSQPSLRVHLHLASCWLQVREPVVRRVTVHVVALVTTVRQPKKCKKYKSMVQHVLFVVIARN